MRSEPAQKAAQLTVNDLFAGQVAVAPDAVAVQSPQGDWTYGQLGDRVLRMAGWLRAQGVRRGDRVAILSENRREFVLTLLAGAKLGAIVACLNWRQSQEELTHCIALVTPSIALVSPRFAHPTALFSGIPLTLIDDSLDAALARGLGDWTAREDAAASAQAEDGLYILYTSGTTGQPKAALISHRALLARGTVAAMDGGTRRGCTFIA